MTAADLVDPLVWEAEQKSERSCLLCLNLRLIYHATLSVCAPRHKVYWLDLMTTPGAVNKMAEKCRADAHRCPRYEVEDE